MASWRVDVTFCLASDAVSLTTLEEDVAVLSAVYNILTKTLHEDASELILSND